MSKFLGMVLVCSSFALGAHAEDHFWHTHTAEQHSFSSHSDAVAAPEIDPASALSGLTLLLGGIAVVRGRRK